VVGAVVNWVHARPWRAGWLLVTAVACGVVVPAAGGLAWLLFGPPAMFVIGYDLWWFARSWIGAVVIVLAVAGALVGSAVLGVGLGSFTEATYTLGRVATTAALVGGYLWGRHRAEQALTTPGRPPDASPR
jgi:hypothetical protein